MHFGASGQHDHARPRDEHGRRLGNTPAARARPRLGDCPARRARAADARRDRHESLQGQLSGQRVARGLPRGGATTRRRWIGAGWFPILPQTKLRAHHRHLFSRELQPSGPVSHVRLNIFPDGGISRLRSPWNPGAGLTRRTPPSARDAAARLLRIDAVGRADGCGGVRSAISRRCWRRRATSGSRSARTTGARPLRTIRRLAIGTRWSAGSPRRDTCPSASSRGVEGAGADVLTALADANRIYEQTFGYIFIVCATRAERGGDACAPAGTPRQRPGTSRSGARQRSRRRSRRCG